MIDLEQLKKANDQDWHRPFGGQITLNCEDVDVLLKVIDKAIDNLITDDRELHKHDGFCEELTKDQWKEYLLSEVSK